VIDLLFVMSHWHGLAKLHIHSDLTLDILDQQTTELGAQFRLFKEKVCPSYETQELNHEVGARSHRQLKDAAKRASANGKERARPEQQDVPILKDTRRKKTLNINTYKFHVLGDYVTSIRHFGTMDSYSTEPVSCRSLLIHRTTHFEPGRVRTPHAERQIQLH
jgi:hypothetical protein